MAEKIKYLHIVGPDTKNSYGIMSQIHRKCDMKKHRFLITAYESCKQRFPKLQEFDDNIFIPEACPWPKRIWRLLFFYRALSNAEILIWHSLYFTTQKYIWFLFFFPSLSKKSVWVEWGADLYVWRFPETSLKNKIKNYINAKIRKRFRYVGVTFPVDALEYNRQFGTSAQCFYTPMPNPYYGPSELIDYILASKPTERKREETMIQVAHNAFTFNNHFYLFDMLERFVDEPIHLVVPISYGVYGINGQYGSRSYCQAIQKYVQSTFSGKSSVLIRNMPFDRYLQLLWSIDIAIFDFDRPCGLGTLRILLLMEKKIFLPSGSPYYDFLVSQGLPICDTNQIPNMTFEEFTAPVIYENKEWVFNYMNNDSVMENWETMFAEIERSNHVQI